MRHQINLIKLTRFDRRCEFTEKEFRTVAEKIEKKKIEKTNKKSKNRRKFEKNRNRQKIEKAVKIY